VYNVEYHVVWITKYRYKVLTGEVALRARELIRQSCMSREISIVRGSVARDHIHLLISCPPGLAPAKIVQYLKGRSSRMLLQEFPHLEKRFWGQHLWGRGYFCATVGAVTEDMIKEYVENQELEKRDEDFKVADE
jgi:putative transposase